MKGKDHKKAVNEVRKVLFKLQEADFPSEFEEKILMVTQHQNFIKRFQVQPGTAEFVKV